MHSIQVCKKQAINLATILILAFPTISSASTVTIQTVLGAIDIQLFDTDAPLTVANFLNYVNSGAYNNTFIHRSVPGFVIQGGGYTFDPNTQTVSHIPTNAPVVNEYSAVHPNVRGTIGMAKPINDPNGATSEWFINLADNSSTLASQDGGFTVFGQVSASGMQVVDAIAALPIVDASALNPALNTLPLVNPFNPATGWQSTNLVTVNNVSAVPVPAAVWLFGSGLFGLTGVARKRKAV